LPILINQWANVVRWELRTRLFLRTTEFLWQEGHTVHANEAEAREETMRMLDVYADFAEHTMAMPVIKGEKTAGERFPGAVSTYSIEAMMQDRKALQAGTSHFLGQNFAKAQDIKYQDVNGQEVHAWTTSWGVSTRLIGGLIMTHSDDDGLVLPPRLAPAHVVILPITSKPESRAEVLRFCHALQAELRAARYDDRNVEVELDLRDLRGGEKNWSWVKKGVPIRLEIGPRDVAQDAVFMARRDRPSNEKQAMPRAQFVSELPKLLGEMQDALLDRAKQLRAKRTCEIDTKHALYDYFKDGNDEAGFAMAHWSGDPEIEQQLKQDLSVTLRCIPLDQSGPGECPFTGKPSKQRVVWARNY
jgi:prolyl-tRNA synthetase